MDSKRKFLAVLLFMGLFNASGLAWAFTGQENVQAAQEAAATPKPKEIKIVKATAYSSTPDQTDDSPFIMANGKRVHDGAVAANFLPFGTKVRFPEVYGDKVFTVEDRMHRRFSDRVDIWMETRGEAIRFGVQELTIEIL